MGWWLPFMLAFAPGLHDPGQATIRQKQILVLYPTRKDAQIVAVGDREMPRILSNRLPEGVDYYSEFIDPRQFSNAETRAAFVESLRTKYRNHDFDVLVTMGAGVIEFADTIRTELFPRTPIVFAHGDPAGRRPQNSTGIAAGTEFAETIDLAERLHPGLRHVFVVGELRALESTARAQFARFEPRLTFSYLSPADATDARLTSLPKHSIVFYTVAYRDGHGRNIRSLDFLRYIASIANAPTYCWVDTAMDYGVVGGRMKDQVAEATAVAELAARVLRGEKAEGIPIASPDLSVARVDRQQLRRWGVSESRLPPGTVVRGGERSFQDQARVYVVGGALLLLAQTVLIAGLLVTDTRRRARTRTSDPGPAFGGRLLLAQEEERERVARALDENLVQQMAVLEFDLARLRSESQGSASRMAEEALDRAHGIARDMRGLSHRLHPAMLRLIGLVPALKSLEQELSRSGLRATVTADDVPQNLPIPVARCVFRVVQEAGKNAVLHSGARQFTVALRGVPGALALTIADDGVGFDPKTALGNGLGLQTMRERLVALGGTLDVHSAPGAGTRLEISLPLRS